MNLTIKRVLVIFGSLAVSIILLGFTSSKTEDLPQENCSSNEKIEREIAIEWDDSLDVATILKEEQTKQPIIESTPTKPKKNTTIYEITHYTSNCKGCTGITASGHNVRKTIYYEGYRIVAAPKSVPLYTKLNIKYEDGTIIKAIVLDRGGAIKSAKLDLLVKDKNEAYRLGRQKVDVEFID